MTVFVLDHFYLLITLIITIGYQLSGFFIAWIFQFDKITDVTGGSNFFILALISLLFGGHYGARNIVATVLQLVWSVRIAGFLLFRVLKRGSDSRFDIIRGQFLSFLAFWIAQILWVWLCSIPVVVLNSPGVSGHPGSNPGFGSSDVIGIILWSIGWLIETIADIDKYRWKSSNPPKHEIIGKRFWKWSRHPPYFGEILAWWGIWALSIGPSLRGTVSSQAKSAQYAGLVSPLFTMAVLIFGSGIPYSSKPTGRRYYLLTHGPNAKPEDARAWSNYTKYIESTSILVPVPPSIYSKLPQFAKYLLLDLPMFKFDAEKDGPAAIEEERAKLERGNA